MRADRRRLELLIAATAKLDTSLEPQQTLRRIAAMALPELAELCVIDLVDEDGDDHHDRRRRRRSRGRRRGSNGCARTSARNGSPACRSRGRCRSAPRTSSHDVAAAPPRPRARRSRPPASCRAATPPSRSATVVPMVARGRLLGVMSFVHAGGPQRGQLRVLEDLTGRAALAYDNARLYAERARVAQTLRRSLMPAALPAVPGLDLELLLPPDGRGQRSRRRLLRRLRRPRRLLARRRRRLRQGRRGSRDDGVPAPHDRRLCPRGRAPREGAGARQ